MNPRLVAVAGPLSGGSWSLDREKLTIGRHVSNDVQIREPEVSRHHCVISQDGGRFLLKDLGSRGGALVNGQPVRERALQEGDVVTLGRSRFVFLTRDETPGVEALLQEGGYEAESTVHLPVAELPPRDLRAARDLAALIEIGTTLHSFRASGPLAKKLLELMFEVFPAERAAVLLLGRGELELSSAFAFEKGKGGVEPFPISRTVVERVFRDRVALLSNDVLQTQGLAGSESLQACRIRSLACAPLTGPEGVVGVLYLDTRTADVRLDEDHLRLLTALAGIAGVALANARHVEWLESEARRLDGALGQGELIGEGRRMQEVHRLIARVAPTESTVLLRGESGTGKELAARAIHRHSSRQGRPFVAINCASLTETLLESELFGHERGAFTGAVERKIGKVEVAASGTLFLDEVGELPSALQAKLLRFLQEREFERLGGTRPIKVDVRLIAATNRDLEKAIREGGFRQDLFYRLNVISITLPPLRERREDVHLLASHFANVYGAKAGRRAAGFTPEARACLERYGWPGNVRELANAVERAVVLGEGELIGAGDLPETVLEAAPAGRGAAVGEYHEAVNGFKRRLILDAVEQAGGNITKAAELLGLNPTYLHRLIRNLDLRTQAKD
ncbi:MAG TPA: sigma 54-interacting transcriptional regulator [Thermoanaerobaculia bacterium]